MPRDPLAFLQRQQQRQPRRDPIAFLRRQAPPLTPMRAPQVPPGTLEDLQIGAARGYLGLTSPIEAAGDIVAGALTGDFQPLAELGRGIGLRAGQFYAGLQPGGAGAVTATQAAIDEERARRERRQFGQGNLPAIRRAAQEAQLAKLEAQDPSLAGRLTRGAVSTAIQSAPYLAAAPGGIPALAATGAAMSLGEPENIPLSTGLAVTPLPIGQAFRAGVNAVRRTFGKGAAQIVEAEALPAATARVRESIGEVAPASPPTVPTGAAVDPLIEEAKQHLTSIGIDLASDRSGLSILQRRLKIGYARAERIREQIRTEARAAQPAASMQSVFGKLETDNVEQIGAMIANANRRFRKSSTPAERQSSWDDYKRLNQLTPDEQRALGQVLPARTVSPVGEFAEGGYSREIRDIPMSEPNPQLDANLRELEQFFGGQRGAQAAPTVPAGRVVTAGDKTYRLTPEQEARWAAEVDEPLANARRQAEALRATGRGSDRQRADEITRGESMRTAATKRQIVGALTPKEEAAIAAREATNYRGKPVIVDIGGRQVPATVEGMAFGRVKVRLEDGRRITVEPAGITAETGPPALSADMSISAATPRAAGASVTGPRTQTAAMEVSPTPPASAAAGAPVEFTGVEPWARAPQQQQLFDAAARSPWQDTVLAYFRGNLLTNPVSRANDLGQTIINQFADAWVRPIAAAVDVVVSKLTGKRAITGPSLTGTGQAFGSARQGLRDVKEVLRTGRQVIDSGADDVLYGSEIRSGLGRGFDVPVNGLFRIMGAMDAPFRRFGYARNLFDRARVAAINEAKRGKIPWDQKSARIRELMDRDDIIKAAIRDGEKAVLSESNKFSAWVASQTRNSPNARLAVGIIQPFMRIPANAAMKAADFAGVGGVKALYKVARGVGRKAKGQRFFRDLEDQRVFSQNVAAGSFGVAGFLLGMELEDQGKLEGFYYTSGKDYPNGRVPTSINIGGKNYDVNRLGGFIFAPLFVGATYNRLRKQDVGKANALLGSFSGLAQQAPGLGYYGAPAKAGRILTSEKRGAEIAKQAGDIGVGFIPAGGLVRATAKAFDLLPGKGPRSPFVDATLEQNRPLFSELQRLNKRVSELRRKTKQVYKDGKWTSVDDETDDKFNARVQQFSANYTRFGLQLINSPRFKAAPDVVKDIALDRLDQRAKAITHREFAFPEIELDANIIMDAAEQSEKNPEKK